MAARIQESHVERGSPARGGSAAAQTAIDLSHAVLSGINMAGAVLSDLNMALVQSSAEMRSHVRRPAPFKDFAA